MSARTRLDGPEHDASLGGRAQAPPAREPALVPVPLGTPRGVARLLAVPGGGSAVRAALLGLQRTAGNAALQRIAAASSTPTVQRGPFDEEQSESRAEEPGGSVSSPSQSESSSSWPFDEEKSEPGVEPVGETLDEKFYRLVYEKEYAAALSLVVQATGSGGKNVASISYDGNIADDGQTDSKKCFATHPGHAVGAKGRGPDHPQDIKIGRSAFTYFSYCASVIGHEMQHVQDRTKEQPQQDTIEDKALGEFIAYSGQVLGPQANLSKKDLRANAFQAYQAYQAMTKEDQNEHLQRYWDLQNLRTRLGPAPGAKEIAELKRRRDLPEGAEGKISPDECEAQIQKIIDEQPIEPGPSWTPAAP